MTPRETSDAGFLTRAALPIAVLAWAAALTAAGFLAFRRYEAAMASDMRFDFETFYIPAAEAIARGESPYSVDGYVYSPLIAVVLAPLVDTPWVEEAWTVTLVASGILTCVLATLASTRGMPAALRAGVFGLSAVTLMSSWPMTIEVWMGQADLLVALCVAAAMFAAATGTRGLAGLSLGIAALVKTWPATLLLWLLRAPRRDRVWDWAAVGAAAGGAVLLALWAGGLPGLRSMLIAPIETSSQSVVAYSALGAGKLLFSDSGVSEPLIASPILRVATTIVLFVWVVALLVLALQRPGDAVVALPNVAFCVLLLLPVSHYVYLIIALPALWWWSARAMRTPQNWLPWLVFVALLVWWLLAMRRIPPGDVYTATDWRSYLVILGTTLLAATASVIGAAGLGAAPAVTTPRSPQ